MTREEYEKELEYQSERADGGGYYPGERFFGIYTLTGQYNEDIKKLEEYIELESVSKKFILKYIKTKIKENKYKGKEMIENIKNAIKAVKYNEWQNEYDYWAHKDKIKELDDKIYALDKECEGRFEEWANAYDGLRKANRKLSEQENSIKEAYIVANNALYFNDNSDYGTALFKILKILNPAFNEEDELVYIEEN